MKISLKLIVADLLISNINIEFSERYSHKTRT